MEFEVWELDKEIRGTQAMDIKNQLVDLWAEK